MEGQNLLVYLGEKWAEMLISETWPFTWVNSPAPSPAHRHFAASHQSFVFLQFSQAVSPEEADAEVQTAGDR